MKRNAIVRIVLLSVLAVVLICLLLAGLGIGSLQFEIPTSSSGTEMDGEMALSATEIRNLEIEWVSGSVNIQIATDGSQDLRVWEEGVKDAPKGTWEIRGQTLILHYSRPAIQFGFVNTPKKDLTIVFPADWYCNELDIETVSGDVNVSLLSMGELNVEGVSAECIFESCITRNVKLSTVSGDVEYRGEVGDLSCEGVSGDCKVVLFPTRENPIITERIQMEAVSGDLTIAMQEGTGFTTQLDTVSGHVYSDFATSSMGGDQVFGDGKCQIQAETVSGNVYIKRTEIRFTENCQHAWNNGEIMVVPGTSEQVRVYTCSICGKTKTT